MNVLLIQSPTGRPEAPIYPLGLAFLSSNLKALGHRVCGLDLSLSGDCGEDLRSAVSECSPALVAVSLRNIDDSSWPVTWSYLDAFDEIISELETYKGVVAVGGPGFSIYAKEILSRWPRVDYGVAGDGETALSDLVSALEMNRRPEQRLVHAARLSPESLLNPDYTLFPVGSYAERGAIGVQSRRGCPFGCRYCTYGEIGGRTFRNRPVESVIRDIRQLENLGASSFMFVDSVFDHPVDYAEELVKAIGDSGCGLQWGAWLSETASPGFMERLWESGCRWVDFSPDAVTAKGLRLLGKPRRNRSLYSVVRDARRVGFTVGVNFFNGNPGEGFGGLLLKFMFMLRARLCLGWSRTFVNIGTIRVYPGSPMAKDLPPETDLMQPVFHAPRGLSGAVFRLFSELRRRRRQ
jgi:radical SAM superfamily enzyme YgiQ (UPF0313 family)